MDILFKYFKISILISLFWIVSLFSLKLTFTANDTTFNTVIDDEITYTFDEKIENIISKQDYSLYVSNTKSYLYSDVFIVEIPEEINDFEYNKCIYLISDNIVLKYNFKTIKDLKLNDYILFDLFVDDDYIYVCGMKNNNAVVLKLNQNLEIKEEIELGGDGTEYFFNIKVIDNIYYLIGIKDSISNNSPFKNVGLPNTQKVFIIKYFDEIIDELYFNSCHLSEELTNVIYQEYIYILLSTNEIFILDYDFNVIPSKQYYYQFDNIFIDVDKTIGTYKISNNELFINNEFVFNADDEIILFDTSNNVILYTINNSKITKYNLFIYKIVKNEELILDKFNFDYHTLDNLIIYSPFEKLEKTLLDSTILNKQIHGKYNVTYLIKRPNNKTFSINGKLAIKPYINIIDSGIYKPGKTLSFFGKAYLNGDEIFNGHVVTNSGEYTLKLYDNLFNETIYSFKVIDDYYKDCEIIDFQTEYQVYQNEVVTICLLTKNFNINEIKEIIINNQTHSNFEFIDDEIKIYLDASNNYKIEKYHLNKIILNNAEEIIIDEVVMIKTLKKELNITLDQSLNQDKIVLDYNISDLDKASMYLKTNIYENNKFIKTLINYFDNELSTMEQLNKENITVEHVLVYHNGASLKEVKLLKYDIDSFKKDFIYELKFNVDSSLKQISIYIDYKKVKLNNLIVNDTNILKNINLPNVLNDNKALYLIILGSFTVFSFSLVLLKIKRKRKNKQTN